MGRSDSRLHSITAVCHEFKMVGLDIIPLQDRQAYSCYFRIAFTITVNRRLSDVREYQQVGHETGSCQHIARSNFIGRKKNRNKVGSLVALTFSELCNARANKVGKACSRSCV